ncbi:MAG: hypothetical protein ACXAD7_14365, partial [Candidatus Kariarchaeaceae archaeon]
PESYNFDVKDYLTSVDELSSISDQPKPSDKPFEKTVVGPKPSSKAIEKKVVIHKEELVAKPKEKAVLTPEARSMIKEKDEPKPEKEKPAPVKEKPESKVDKKTLQILNLFLDFIEEADDDKNFQDRISTISEMDEAYEHLGSIGLSQIYSFVSKGVEKKEELIKLLNSWKLDGVPR